MGKNVKKKILIGHMVGEMVTKSIGQVIIFHTIVPAHCTSYLKL